MTLKLNMALLHMINVCSKHIAIFTSYSLLISVKIYKNVCLLLSFKNTIISVNFVEPEIVTFALKLLTDIP